MKIKSVLFSMLLSTIFICFQSCSGDDSDEPDDGTAECNDFESNYKQVTEALTAYSNNPNPETCEDYKNALLDFYSEYNDCPYWADYYQEAYDEIKGVDCSGEGTD